MILSWTGSRSLSHLLMSSCSCKRRWNKTVLFHFINASSQNEQLLSIFVSVILRVQLSCDVRIAKANRKVKRNAGSWLLMPLTCRPNHWIDKVSIFLVGQRTRHNIDRSKSLILSQFYIMHNVPQHTVYELNKYITLCKSWNCAQQHSTSCIGLKVGV